MKKKNTEYYKNKLIQTFGNKFDYSKINYISDGCKSTIICPKHREVEIILNSKLFSKKTPCKLCSKKVRTNSMFLEEAKMLREEEYFDYLSEFENTSNNILIQCKICGYIFSTNPSSHLAGSGCPKCYGNLKYTKESFLQLMNEMYGSKFDFSNIEFNGIDSEINVKCAEHGWFSIKPKSLITGHSCKGCRDNSLFEKDFIEKMKETNPEYKIIGKFKNKSTKIEIKCPEHGIFKMSPYDLLERNRKCPECNGKNIDTEKFIKMCKKHFPDYDYSMTVYNGMKKPVTYGCKEHGLKTIKYAENLKNGHGCKECGTRSIIPIDLKTEFDGKDYREEYIKLIRNATPKGKTEKHHILPKCIFPLWKNKESNLVELSMEDHYRAHYLLYKIYGGKELTTAFFLMFNKTNKEYNPELYLEVRNKRIESIGNKVECNDGNKFNSFEEAGRHYNVSGKRIKNACLKEKKINGLYFKLA